LGQTSLRKQVEEKREKRKGKKREERRTMRLLWRNASKHADFTW